MSGWHHWLNGHTLEQYLRDGEGQGSLACCSPKGHKELSNWTAIAVTPRMLVPWIWGRQVHVPGLALWSLHTWLPLTLWGHLRRAHAFSPNPAPRGVWPQHLPEGNKENSSTQAAFSNKDPTTLTTSIHIHWVFIMMDKIKFPNASQNFRATKENIHAQASREIGDRGSMTKIAWDSSK